MVDTVDKSEDGDITIPANIRSRSTCLTPFILLFCNTALAWYSFQAGFHAYIYMSQCHV